MRSNNLRKKAKGLHERVYNFGLEVKNGTLKLNRAIYKPHSSSKGAAKLPEKLERQEIIFTIRHFRHFLEGHEFYVLTDHKPLTHALSAAPSRYSSRETRHLDFTSQFTSDIRHINGEENPVADALSRMDINALNYSFAIDFTILAAAQQNDPQIPALKTSSSLCLQDVPLPFSTGTILCDISKALPRPYVQILIVVLFLISYIRSRLLEFVLHNSSLLKGSFGLVSTYLLHFCQVIPHLDITLRHPCHHTLQVIPLLSFISHVHSTYSAHQLLLISIL